MSRRPDKNLSEDALNVLEALVGLADAASGDRAVRPHQISMDVCGYVNQKWALIALVDAALVTEVRGLRPDSGMVETVLLLDRAEAQKALTRHGRSCPPAPEGPLPTELLPGVRSRRSPLAERTGLQA
jgi:hypothetical protein